jgi:hypothetical protein
MQLLPIYRSKRQLPFRYGYFVSTLVEKSGNHIEIIIKSIIDVSTMRPTSSSIPNETSDPFNLQS